MESEFSDFLRLFGDYEKMNLDPNPRSNKNLGPPGIFGDPQYAKVTYSDHSKAKAALQQLDGCVLRGRDLVANWYIDTGAVYISNICSVVTKSVFEEAFLQFGDIISSKLDVNPDKNHSGSGYVLFTKRRVACYVDKLLKENMFVLGGVPRPLLSSLFPPCDIEEDTIRNIKTAPHFCQPNSLEWDFASEWRQLDLRQLEERKMLEVV
ncbi:hypothetical protein WA158_005571 [Blastocystis sp. Blastoise]